MMSLIFLSTFDNINFKSLNQFINKALTDNLVGQHHE